MAAILASTSTKDKLRQHEGERHADTAKTFNLPLFAMRLEKDPHAQERCVAAGPGFFLRLPGMPQYTPGSNAGLVVRGSPGQMGTGTSPMEAAFMIFRLMYGKPNQPLDIVK